MRRNLITAGSRSTELTRLRQICCDPALCFEDYGDETAKTDACMELVQSAVDGGHRLLVFSQFTSMLDILSSRLDGEHVEHFMITGSTPKEKRLQLVNAFNGGAVPVFLISLKAGGVGLNLTGADMVVHYDPWWNLAAQNQATDRAHRIGQQKNVTVYKLITKDSIEEKVLSSGDKTGAGRPDHRTGNGAGGSHDQGRYAEASGDPDVNRGKPP
ncbi:MAG: DEAD/DEAH box helicase [Enterocloster sp.]